MSLRPSLLGMTAIAAVLVLSLHSARAESLAATKPAVEKSAPAATGKKKTASPSRTGKKDATPDFARPFSLTEGARPLDFKLVDRDSALKVWPFMKPFVDFMADSERHAAENVKNEEDRLFKERGKRYTLERLPNGVLHVASFRNEDSKAEFLVAYFGDSSIACGSLGCFTSAYVNRGDGYKTALDGEVVTPTIEAVKRGKDTYISFPTDTGLLRWPLDISKETKERMEKKKAEAAAPPQAPQKAPAPATPEQPEEKAGKDKSGKP